MFRSIIQSRRQLVQFRNLSKYARNPQIYIHEDTLVPQLYKFSLSKSPLALHMGTSLSLNPTAADFKANNEFIKLLDFTLQDNIHDDFTYIMEASTNASSFMPIYDMREIPRYARTPYIEDVFGYVQVDDKGSMIPNSYQKNEMYQICSGKTGLPVFSEFLFETLQEKCEQSSSS